jgi:hypothetical protein
MDYSAIQDLAENFLVKKSLTYHFQLNETSEPHYPFEPHFTLSGIIIPPEILNKLYFSYEDHINLLKQLGQQIREAKFGENADPKRYQCRLIKSPSDMGSLAIEILISEKFYDSDKDWKLSGDLVSLQLDLGLGRLTEKFILYEWHEFLLDIGVLTKYFLNDVRLITPILLSYLQLHQVAFHKP